MTRPSRPLLMLSAMGTAMVAGWASGLTRALEPAALAQWFVEAGPVGVVLFVAVFAGSTLLGVPGVVFLVAAVLTWGPWLGSAVGLVGALVTAAVNFTVMRRVGGTAPTPRARWMRQALAGLERRPQLITAALRATTVLAPPVTAALALSSIRTRDYLVGSAVGLLAPIAVVAWSSDCLLAKLLT